MFPQLAQRMSATEPGGLPAAVSRLLQSDPYDVLLAVDETWNNTNVFGVPYELRSKARMALYTEGSLHDAITPLPTPPSAAPQRPWDHLIYAYMIENTRAIQIFTRLVREFRSGEALGIASPLTQRWLDTTEALLFGSGASPMPAFLATSALRVDAEAIRRNAYYRLFNMELSFGSETNGPASYLKPLTANGPLVALLEELLFEGWRAIANLKNSSGENQADDDRIFRLCEEIAYLLNERTQNATLAREELAAVAVTSWIELVLSSNNDVIRDLRAEGSSVEGRLKLIGEHVKMQPHSRTDALTNLAAPLSKLLRTIQAGIVSNADFSWVIYDSRKVGGVEGIGTDTRRVITEWSAATGRDLKARKTSIAERAPKQLVGAGR